MPNILFTTPDQSSKYLPFVLHGLGMDHNQEPIYRPNGMPAYQWIQCVSGQGVCYINEEKYTVKPGQGIFLYPNVGHRYHSINVSSDWIVNFVCFSGAFLDIMLEPTPLKTSGVFSVNESEFITNKLQNIYSNSSLSPVFAAASHSSDLYNVLLHLILHGSTADSTSFSAQNQRIAPAIAYIEEHYQEPLFLDDIAKQCGLSEEYLCNLFKKTTGMRVFEYIQKTRINRCKEFLIAMPDLPCHIIGQLCGFNSNSYFNKIFKKHELISPGEFRLQNGIGRR